MTGVLYTLASTATKLFDAFNQHDENKHEQQQRTKNGREQHSDPPFCFVIKTSKDTFRLFQKSKIDERIEQM